MSETGTLAFQENATKTAKLPKVDMAIFMLTDQRPSGFIKEGTENTRYPEELTAPLRLRVPNTGVRVEKDKDGRTRHVRIRYIKNCPTIDVEQQRKDGWEPNNDLETDQIYFLNGTLAVVNDGDGRTLYEFLTQNIEFADAPNRPSDADAPLYYRHNKEKLAEEVLKNHTLISKANRIVEGLYQEAPGGNVYDEERIDFLCLIVGIKADDYASKTAALLEYAKVAPKNIVQAVDDHMNRLRADVIQARNLGVIGMVDGKLLLLSTQTPVYTFSKRAKDESAQIDEVIKFLTADEMGVQFYDTMKNGIEQAQADMLKTK